MTMRLSRQKRAELVEEIKAHFREQHDEEIGDLKAGFLVDFLLRRLGPSIYNQAIRDAQSFLQDKLVDLEAECHEPEFPRGDASDRRRDGS